MKKVDLYLTVKCDTKIKVGSYKAILVYKGKYKLIENSSISNATTCRLMMQCIIDSLIILKEPCKIMVYTVNSWGIRKIKNLDGSWKDAVSENTPNIDLATQIRDLCIAKKCELKVVIDADKLKSIFIDV